MSVTTRRQGNKWTINELLSLQREYELLELTVQEIAEKHERTETAILYKLDSEGLIDSWNDARGFNSQDYQNNVSKETSSNLEEEQEFGGDDDDEDYQFEENDDQGDEDEYDISDDESEVEKLTERVWSLETSVSEISSMVKNIYSILSGNQTNKKRKPLRTTTTSSV